jgi:hypothetical protein
MKVILQVVKTNITKTCVCNILHLKWFTHFDNYTSVCKFFVIKLIVTLKFAYNLPCYLQSVPINVLENYDLTSMTLEYRRECRQSNLLESLTSSTANVTEDSKNYNNRRPDLEFTHLLRMLADKAEIVRARTKWHSKQNQQVI